MSAKGDTKIFKEIENINSRPKPLRNSSIVQSNGSLPTSMLHLVFLSVPLPYFQHISIEFVTYCHTRSGLRTRWTLTGEIKTYFCLDRILV